MNIPENTHVKALGVTLVPLPGGEVVKEKSKKVKVFSKQDWAKIQAVPGNANKYEFIEEIPHPDHDDVLSLSATGGKETGPWKRYEAALKLQKDIATENERKGQALVKYKEKKDAALREIVKLFKGKQQLQEFLESIHVTGDISANMVDESNLGAVYEKLGGDVEEITKMITTFMELTQGNGNNGGGTAGPDKDATVKAWTNRIRSRKQLGEFMTFIGLTMNAEETMNTEVARVYDAIDGNEKVFTDKLELFLGK